MLARTSTSPLSLARSASTVTHGTSVINHSSGPALHGLHHRSSLRRCTKRAADRAIVRRRAWEVRAAASGPCSGTRLLPEELNAVVRADRSALAVSSSWADSIAPKRFRRVRQGSIVSLAPSACVPPRASSPRPGPRAPWARGTRTGPSLTPDDAQPTVLPPMPRIPRGSHASIGASIHDGPLRAEVSPYAGSHSQIAATPALTCGNVDLEALRCVSETPAGRHVP